jgi:uncharacterized protein with GYD domain
MNTYILLSHFTDQGIQGVKRAPERIEHGRALAKELGGEVKDIYLAMGAYDLVLVTRFPDADAVAKFALRVAATGNLRTTTLQAFPEEQYRSIVATLP